MSLFTFFLLILSLLSFFFFFFFNDTATTEIYTLSLHDALPILAEYSSMLLGFQYVVLVAILFYALSAVGRSEEHTSELQSQSNLVCRLLLEKKKKKMIVIVAIIEKILMSTSDVILCLEYHWYSS